MTDQSAEMRDPIVEEHEVVDLGTGSQRVHGRGSKGGFHQWPEGKCGAGG